MANIRERKREFVQIIRTHVYVFANGEQLMIPEIRNSVRSSFPTVDREKYSVHYHLFVLFYN